MSYQSFKYTPYNSGTSHEHHVQYNASRQQSTAVSPSLNPYPQQSARQQYSQPPYNWQGHQQQGDANGGNQMIEAPGWRSARDQSSHDHAHPQHSRYNSSDSMVAAGYHKATSQAPAQLSTPSLHSLAYASGLESAGISNQNRGSQSNTPVETTFELQARFPRTQDRVQSPSQGKAIHRSTNITSRPAHSHPQPEMSQNLAASAIAALSGDASSRYYQSNQQPPATTAFEPPTTYATSMGSLISTPSNASNISFGNPQSAHIHSEQPVARPGSSHKYQSLPGQVSQRQGHENSRTPETPTQQNIPGAKYQYNRTQRPNEYVPRTHRSSNSSGSIPPPAPDSKMQSHSAYGQVPVSQSGDASEPVQVAQNSYSRQNVTPLTNAGARPGPQPPTNGANNESPHPQDSPANGMPAFIDPSQVYNPYHQEYERRKAAAEAEAKRHVSLAETNPTTQPSNDRNEEGVKSNTEPSLTEALADQSAQVKKPRKPRAKRTRKSEPNPAPDSSQSHPARRMSHTNIDPALQATSLISTESPSDMATDMKLMIEKMREWKSKDPSMFQKLWDDLKKGSRTPQESPQLAHASTVPPQPVQAHAPEGSGSISTGNMGDQGDENLPDLGKFPAKRGDRRSKASIKSGDVTDKSQTTFPAQPASKTDTSKLPPYSPNTTRQREGLVPQPLAAPVQPLKPPSASPTKSSPFRQSSAAPTGLYYVQEPSANAPEPQTTAIAWQNPLMSTQVSNYARPGPSLDKQIQNQSAAGAAGTIWPEGKRKILAESAAQFLKAEYVNKDRQVSSDLILSLLGKNPSYIELCEALESNSIFLHRGKFARHLLSAVPDLLTSPQQHQLHPTGGQGKGSVMTTSTSNNTLRPSTNQPPTQLPPQSQSPMLNYPYPSPHPSQPPAPVPFYSGPQIMAPSAISRQTSNRPRHNASTPAIQAFQPGSKEALARKHAFSDIVDLTQQLSDEEDPHRNKRPRLEDSTITQNGTPSVTVPTVSDWIATAEMDPRATGQSTGIDLSRFMMDQPEEAKRIESLRRRLDIVKPLNKYEALRRSVYDTKTIARDIMVAAGRHPLERPLNVHLTQLRENFTVVDLNSDLSTFKWDIVDPGGPPLPQRPDWKSTDVAVSFYDPNSQTWKKHRPFGKEPISAKSASATNACTSSVPHPHSKHLIKPPSQLRITRNVDSDSEIGSVQALDSAVKSASSNSKPFRVGSSPLTLSNRSLLTMDTPPLLNSKGLPYTGAIYPSGKRRGRPPGAKNKNPTKRSRKAATKAPAGVQIAIPTRPREADLPPPSFNIYMCHWEGCDAKLHNLDTLRKHVAKVHSGRIDGDLQCRWKDCGKYLKAFSIESSHSDQPVSAEERHWFQHMEKAHFEPMAWSLGEGPSASTADGHSLKASSYLNDSNGRKLTPRATTTGALDPLILPAGFIPWRAFNKAHGNVNDFDKAREVLRAMEMKKAKIGPGFDRGGCTLVNAERRKMLVENEGIARVVDGSY